MTIEFVGEHPIFCFFMAYIILECARHCLIRVLRTINLAIRGWPPEHVDLDGDWKPEPKREDE